MKPIKYYISIIVFALLIGSYLDTVYKHSVAYLNNYQVMVYTNKYGEANLEIFMLYSGLVLMIYYFNDVFRKKA